MAVRLVATANEGPPAPGDSSWLGGSSRPGGGSVDCGGQAVGRGRAASRVGERGAAYCRGRAACRGDGSRAAQESGHSRCAAATLDGGERAVVASAALAWRRLRTRRRNDGADVVAIA